jgi:hypothetical protein
MVGPVKRAYLARRAGKSPASPKATHFLNVKHRVIYKTATGKYMVRTAKGVKYAPKVKYYKNPAGSTVHIKYAHANVAIPSPIRPKLVRKVRSNKSVARGKYAPRAGGMRVHHVKRVGFIGPMFEGYAPKRPVGRPRKAAARLVSPLSPLALGRLFRAPRKNKGVKRGPRVGKKTLAANPFAALA